MSTDIRCQVSKAVLDPGYPDLVMHEPDAMQLGMQAIAKQRQTDSIGQRKRIRYKLFQTLTALASVHWG